MILRKIGRIVLIPFVTLLPISMTSAESSIELSEYIENLRQQFVKLNKNSGKDQLPLYISPISVELTVQVVKEGSAGVKFYVADIGGSAESASTQKLSFTVSIGKPDTSYMTHNFDPSQPFFIPRAGIPPLRRPDGG